MNLKIRAEILFWIITAVITFIVMHPIYNYYGMEYPFYWSNIPFIIIFLTYTRYIFLLKYTPFSQTHWVKIGLIFLSIPLLLVLVDGLYEFQRYLDVMGFVDISKDDANEASSMAKYARYQYLFFGTGAIMVLVFLPLRMIVSIWRVTNKKSKV
ncbi:MAG TPA: hypothetical protein PLZ32_03025 [Saprospiraceae bacterium]|nr:hypothetical protein [Saprospiraceae bacterium]